MSILICLRLFFAKVRIFLLLLHETLRFNVMTEIERIDQLREELHTHNHNYYILNAPTISDQEFDRLMRELQDLEAKHPEHYDENSPSVRVGSDLNKEFRQVEHKYPMLSLGNTYSETEVREFYERVRKALNEDFEICCELKFDGTSISLTYEDGRLVQAVTRGDGVRGDDVTDNVKTIRSIPLRLSGEGYPRRFEIRGEILMPWTVFEELNREREQREEPLFANPRNAASGTLKSQNSAVVASRKLDAYLYYLLGEEQPLSLQAAKGNYILLSFWASYDAASRTRNARLHNVVSDDARVEMISISFDRYQSVFNAAVRQDGISDNVYQEMEGENSEIFKSYDLKHGFINYLVNDRGAIVAKNVTPSELASLLHQAEN
jgi:NAD-dependent DNA ligase